MEKVSKDSKVGKSKKGEPESSATGPPIPFFLLDAAWLNDSSLSGRSPFCQLVGMKKEVHLLVRPTGRG